MTRTKVGLAIAAAVVIGALGGGCQEEQASQDVKLHRLIAVENRQLKAEIENLKKQIEEQKQEIAKCEQEKQKITQHSREIEGRQTGEIIGQFKNVMSATIKKNAELRAEIEQLKAELAKLKGEETAEEKSDQNEPGAAE